MKIPVEIFWHLLIANSKVMPYLIAFGNTSGGRIHVGVNDRDASPQGWAELWKAFKGSGSEALKTQGDRLRWLVTNRIAPTPHFTVEEVRVFDQPIITVTVEPGSVTHYDRSSNEVWVRRGASNERPKPDEGAVDEQLS